MVGLSEGLTPFPHRILALVLRQVCAGCGPPPGIFKFRGPWGLIIIYVWFRREIIPLVFTIQNNYPVAVIIPLGIITKSINSRETFVPPK